MALPKWTDERTNKLIELVDGESPVCQVLVAKIAEELETSKRSIASKLRNMGLEVDSAATSQPKTFSDTQEATLADFLDTNDGEYTYSEIAERFEAGAFNAKQIQGKVLSMELTGNVKATVPPETVKKYTEEQEEIFLSMARDGAFLEDIAEVVGKEMPSVRGKALSFLRSGELESIPKQRDVKSKATVDVLADVEDLDSYTVETLAEKLGKTPRGVRTMLTRRGLSVSDYDGAAKKAKNTEASE